MIEIIGYDKKCVQNALNRLNQPVFNRFSSLAGRFNASSKGVNRQPWLVPVQISQLGVFVEPWKSPTFSQVMPNGYR